MTQPDPEFIRFFSGDYRGRSEWGRLLSLVEVFGMPAASWDRKAAWLLLALGRLYDADMPHTWVAALESTIRPSPARPWPPVGTGDINPIEDASCRPQAGGIALDFDATEWCS